MNIKKIIQFFLMAAVAVAAQPRIPLALGGQFEIITNAGSPHYSIMPFASGYINNLGHVKVGIMQESFDAEEGDRIYTVTDTRFMVQAVVDLVAVGGGSYVFYKITNHKIEKDNKDGDSDWVMNQSIGIGAQHYLSPFFGLTAEMEYLWDYKRINYEAPTESPLSGSTVRINLGFVFFFY